LSKAALNKGIKLNNPGKSSISNNWPLPCASHLIHDMTWTELYRIRFTSVIRALKNIGHVETLKHQKKKLYTIKLIMSLLPFAIWHKCSTFSTHWIDMTTFSTFFLSRWYYFYFYRFYAFWNREKHAGWLGLISYYVNSNSIS
jgi:hypothetical protein